MPGNKGGLKHFKFFLSLKLNIKFYKGIGKITHLN